MKKLIAIILILSFGIALADISALSSDLKTATNGESPQLQTKLGTIIDKVNEEVANTTKTAMTITTLGTTTLTVGGVSTLTGKVTAATGFTQTPVARSANATRNATAGTVAAGTSMVAVSGTTVTQDAYFITLPAPVKGHTIVFLPNMISAYEIIPALRTEYINGTQCTVEKSLQVPTGSMMTAVCTSVNSTDGLWVITQQDNDGTTDAGGTPD